MNHASDPLLLYMQSYGQSVSEGRPFSESKEAPLAPAQTISLFFRLAWSRHRTTTRVMKLGAALAPDYLVDTLHRSFETAFYEQLTATLQLAGQHGQQVRGSYKTYTSDFYLPRILHGKVINRVPEIQGLYEKALRVFNEKYGSYAELLPVFPPESQKHNISFKKESGLIEAVKHRTPWSLFTHRRQFTTCFGLRFLPEHQQRFTERALVIYEHALLTGQVSPTHPARHPASSSLKRAL